MFICIQEDLYQVFVFYRGFFFVLQPQNMLLTRDYPDTDIVLCDFGISRVIQDGVEVREILGTPDYVGEF